MNEKPEPQVKEPPMEEKPVLNALQRFLGIFFSPAKTFQDINRKPSFILPLVVMIIFSLAATVVIMPKIDMETTIQQSLDKMGKQLSEEEMGQAVAVREKIGKAIAYPSAFLAPILMTLIVAAIFFGIIRLWGAGSTFSRVFSVIAHSYLVTLIKSVLIAILAFRKESESLLADEVQDLVKSNLSLLLDREEAGMALYTLASKIDLFSIWTVILMIIGLSAVSKLNIKQSAAAVLITWLVYVALSTALVAIAARFNM